MTEDMWAEVNFSKIDEMGGDEDVIRRYSLPLNRSDLEDRRTVGENAVCTILDTNIAHFSNTLSELNGIARAVKRSNLSLKQVNDLIKTIGFTQDGDHYNLRRVVELINSNYVRPSA